MTDEDKIKLINYLKEGKSVAEIMQLEEELLQNEEHKALLKSYEEMIKKIDLIYARKMIKKELKGLQFSEEELLDNKSLNKENSDMNTKSTHWIQYPIMIVIAIIVSWIVFSIASKDDSEENGKEVAEVVNIETTNSDPADNRIKMDVENNGIDIMGIALNTSGYYLLPYSVNELPGVFGSTKEMTNNLPLTVIWDDKEMGLAVAAFADENLTKLKAIPYSFSKDDFFLGEEMFLIFSAKSKVSINRGIIIEDDAVNATMKIHLDLQGDVYGAVVMDKSGMITGICERQDEDGNAIVIKSKEIYQMIAEMNLDKGVPYINLPKNNYLKNKSNSERIETIQNYVAWFNAK